MIYTVTFNPSIDYIVSVEKFTMGKVNRTTSELMLPGGKGINVSQVLTNLGVKNTALGFVAGFTGEQLTKMVREKGIYSDFIQVEDGMTRINVKVRTAMSVNTELETEINAQGPKVTETELECLMNKINLLTEDDILVLSGSVCKGVSQNIYADIVRRCKDKNIKVVVDASGPLLCNVLEYNPFLIKPNHHELGAIFDRHLNSHNEIVFFAKELQNRGAKNVLVSMGGEGAILVTESGAIYTQKAPVGKVINTVGAGDSMVAGFLSGYIETADYMFSLKKGICAGSASAFSEELAKREMVEILMNLV